MKNYLKQGLLLGALSAVAGSAGAVQDYYLAAKEFTKTMPDSSTVQMWGYVEDTGGACYNTTPASARLTCVNALPDPEAPGPRLTVAPTEPNLRIFLSNGLPEPTSVVITGQEMPFSQNNNGPTWDDNTTGARGADLNKRVRSFGLEAAANGGRQRYLWNNFRNTPFTRPGTFIYHSGTHPQKQVYMGMYGAVTKDNAAGVAYPGVSYDNEVILFYSEIDPELNAAVAGGTHDTSIHYHAKWFLVNGEPYEDGVTPNIAAGAAGTSTLVRYLSTAGETHVPTLQGLYQNIHAEDGIPYSWQNGATGASTPAPREQYTVMLPPLKTKDAIITAPADGTYAVYDGNGYMTNPSDPGNFGVGDTVGGMLRFLAFDAAANQPPTAVADAAVTDENVSVDIDVLANDTDPENDTITITANDTAGTIAGSTVSCVPTTGPCTYTPVVTGVSAVDTFTYTITDGNNPDVVGTVTVTINAVNLPPTANADSAATNGVTPVDIDVLANDTDPENDTLTIDSVDTTGTAGTVACGTIPSAGPCTYTPATGFSGADTFAYTASDGTNPPTAPATVTVTVNAPPTAMDDAGTTVDGTPLVINVLANDTDPEPDTLSINSVDTTGTQGTVSCNNTTGDCTYTPNGVIAADTFTYTATDGGSISNQATVTVTVTDTGTPPVLLYFSTVGNSTVPANATGPFDDANIYAYDGAVYSTEALASVLSIPNDIDGLHRVDVDTFYVSFVGNPTLPVIGQVQDEDVVMYNEGTWSLAFDGNTVCGGLQGINGLDIDAFDVVGGVLYFTTTSNTALRVGSGVGPGLGQAWDNSDIYRWDGTTCSRIFDRDQSGVGGSNVDGLTIVDEDTFYLSFANTNVSVPVVGNVQDEDVVLNDAGTWTVYFNGTANGLTTNGHDVDAVHVP